MVKAIVSRGEIHPLEPLPPDWQEGQPLRSEAADEEQLERSLQEAHRQAKEHVRRQMEPG
jgi:hypothetical protein